MKYIKLFEGRKKDEVYSKEFVNKIIDNYILMSNLNNFFNLFMNIYSVKLGIIDDDNTLEDLKKDSEKSNKFVNRLIKKLTKSELEILTHWDVFIKEFDIFNTKLKEIHDLKSDIEKSDSFGDFQICIKNLDDSGLGLTPDLLLDVANLIKDFEMMTPFKFDIQFYGGEIQLMVDLR